MGWFVAWLMLGLGLGALCQGAVGMPFLYGLFIVGIILLPIAVICGAVNSVIDGIFGRRR